MAPFSSSKQRAFMYSQHPKIAKKWRKESGPQKNLPTYARKSLRSLFKSTKKSREAYEDSE